MYFRLWQQRLLTALGVLLIVVPVIGIPVVVKTFFFVIAGLALLALLIAAEDGVVAGDATATQQIETVTHDPIPQHLHEEPVVAKKFSDHFPVQNPISDLVPSPIKTTTVRRRRTKIASTPPIEDHVESF